MLNETGLQAEILSVLTTLRRMACHGQTHPNGKPCAICESNKHSASECYLNAFVMLEKIRNRRCKTQPNI